MSPKQDIHTLLARATDLRKRPRAANTVRHDTSAIRKVRQWATELGIDLPSDSPWPVDVVVAYVASYLDHGAANTARAYVAAIRRWHTDRGLESPTRDMAVCEALAGLCRQLPSTVRRRKPMPPDAIRAWLSHDGVSTRAKAAILVGFVTGLRAGELCALRWDDVLRVSGGLELRVRAAKTAKARVVGVPAGDVDSVCPVAWLEAWRRESGVGDRVFPVCTHTIWRWARRAAKIAGLDWRQYGAHSLRSGMMTAASSAGVALTETMAAGGWETASVAAKYARPEATQNAAHRAAVRALGEG